MKFSVLFLFFLLNNALCAPKFEYALTFDDAPMGDMEVYSGKNRTIEFVKKITKNNLPPVMFFCNPKNKSEEIFERLKLLEEYGQLLANHSMNHMDYHQNSMMDFRHEIFQAHEYLSQFKTYHHFFRYPYLREGDTPLKQTYIKDYLAITQIKHGYITVELYDWHINRILQNALINKYTINQQAFKELYLAIITESVTFYNQLATKSLGRIPAHIILLHANDLNALYILDIVKALNSIGGKMISPIKAFEDPISDQKYNPFPNSMRRLSAIARYVAKISGPNRPVWTNTEYIDAIFEKYKIIIRE